MAAKIRTFMSTNPPEVPPIEVSQHTNAHCEINICVFPGFFNTVGGFAFTFTSQSYTRRLSDSYTLSNILKLVLLKQR